MGRIKSSMQHVIGKTIQCVVLCQTPGSEPENQLFLVFKDGTSFEIWIDQGQFSIASKVDDEDLNRVVELAEQRDGTKVHVIESPIACVGKSRVEREPAAAKNNPLDNIPVSAIDEEHALFLAIHRRDAFLYRLAREMDAEEQRQWVDLVSEAFGNLLGQCSFESMYDGCSAKPAWQSVVHPPSVLPAELMQFLGGLSVVNSSVYALVKERAAVSAFVKHFGLRYFESGQTQGQDVMRNLDAPTRELPIPPQPF